jgi:sarcosine oxidase, subunit gamma
VIAEAVRRSPLAGYRERFIALSAATRGDLLIHERPFLSQVNFRADPNDAITLERIVSSLGFALPLAPNTVTSRGERRALWLGPDEWLIVAPVDQEKALAQALRAGLEGAFGSIVDVSANRTVLEIGGPNARDLLAHGVPVDLDSHSFGPGRCAQTLLAKAQVIIERRPELAFQVYVRSSFASYVADCLLDAVADAISSTSSGRQGRSQVIT